MTTTGFIGLGAMGQPMAANLVRKGHDIVCIDPPGKLCPLYQRDHYRDNATLWKKTTRYLDEKSLDW